MTVLIGGICDALLLDSDNRPFLMEVGDSVYEARCDFDGDVEADIDHVDRVVTWVCPKCGTEYNIVDDAEPFWAGERYDDQGEFF